MQSQSGTDKTNRPQKGKLSSLGENTLSRGIQIEYKRQTYIVCTYIICSFLFNSLGTPTTIITADTTGFIPPCTEIPTNYSNHPHSYILESSRDLITLANSNSSDHYCNNHLFRVVSMRVGGKEGNQLPLQKKFSR